MRYQWVAACAMLLGTAGCGGHILPSPRDIRGQYAMTGLDGSRNLPCCSQTDSAGAVVTIAGGEMQIGWNTPDGTYQWDVVRTYHYPDGTSNQGQSRFASGTYARDGETLALRDSSGLATITGTVAGNIVNLLANDQQYEFLRLIQLPH